MTAAEGLTDTEKHYLVINNLGEASKLRKEGRGWNYIQRYLKAQDPRWTPMLLWQLERALKIGGLDPKQELDSSPETADIIHLGKRDKAAQELAQTCANTHIEYTEACQRMEKLHGHMEQPVIRSIQNDDGFDFYTLDDCYRWLWRFYRFDYVLGDGEAKKTDGSGRPGIITLKDKDRIFHQHLEGNSIRDIAQACHVSVGSAHETIKKEKSLRKQ